MFCSRNLQGLVLPMQQTFLEYFRCPKRYAKFARQGGLSEKSGFFKFGAGIVGYGKYAGYEPAISPRDDLRDALEDVGFGSGSLSLPFDLDEVVNNLRLELYTEDRHLGRSGNRIVRWLYYSMRPFFPVGFRRHLQRAYLSDWKQIAFPNWPVDHTVDDFFRVTMRLLLRAQDLETIPFIWFWPDGASSGVAMTHDVETTIGRDFCSSLMDINESFGIRASFQIVPEERYSVSKAFLDSIQSRGFEVNVQDLNHDGNLYRERNEFVRRARKINEYGRRFGATGFRSAVLYRRQEWLSYLDFSYDMSVPSTGHLEPQRGGCCTVMPYFIGNIVELPVTTTQDYSLFNYLRSFSIDLWKKQICLILKQNGMMTFIIHPDYIMTDWETNIYKQLLTHLASVRDRQDAWIATPGEIDRWWRQRSKMEMVNDGESWRIEGDGNERARIAYASERDGRLVFKLQQAANKPPSPNKVEL